MKIKGHIDMSLAEYRRLICLQLAVASTRVYPSEASGEIERAKRYEEYLKPSHVGGTGSGVTGGGGPALEWCPICNRPRCESSIQGSGGAAR